MYGIKCSQCTKSFKTLTELKRHTISEHSNRPYACPHCPHKSNTKDKLDRHLLSHSTPRESFQCEHCEKKFVFKNSLKKHLEKKRCEALKPPKLPRLSLPDVNVPDLLAWTNYMTYIHISNTSIVYSFGILCFQKHYHARDYLTVFVFVLLVQSFAQADS